MLTLNSIVNNFSDVVEIGNGIVRFTDKLPKVTYYYYIRFADECTNGHDLVMVSENIVNDEFASTILLNCPQFSADSKLEMHPLALNVYGFSNLLLAPHNFHSYFKGRLDAEREKLLLCLPVHKSEFSGAESVEEFYLLRREIVETLNWDRKLTPKIILRFDNPKTRGGTSDEGAFVKYATVLHEIENIDGVVNGFLEILNYKSEVFEVLSPAVGQFVIIRNRDDSKREAVSKENLLAQLWQFLTE